MKILDLIIQKVGTYSPVRGGSVLSVPSVVSSCLGDFVVSWEVNHVL